MSSSAFRMAWLAGLLACGGPEARPEPASNVTDLLPLQPSPPSGSGAPAAAPGRAFVDFVDPETGLSAQDVHDADRQVVRFDAARDAMVWAASGDSVSGWAAEGNDLRGGAFRVLFGEEQGERRAYFTEAGPGTICDLEITGPEQLSISPTSETPPRP